MSEKRLASEKTVQAFIRAVYPESTELCMTVNSEEDVLREATRLILERRAPDPEKQELVNMLRRTDNALFLAGKLSMGPSDMLFEEAMIAVTRTRLAVVAFLRRHEGGEG